MLINNVGGAINFKPFTEFTDAEIRAEIDRSLMTTLYACRAALPSMVERGQGVIVNVSSAATQGIHRIPYSAAKGGINAITASLAMEYADAGIRVVATAPGGTAGTAAADLAGHTGAAQRHRARLVPGAHRPDHRVLADEALRHARRTGGRDLLPGLRRGLATSPARCCPSPAATRLNSAVHQRNPETTMSQPRRTRALAWVVALSTAALIFDGYDLVVYGTVVRHAAGRPHPARAISPQQAGALGSYALIGVMVGALSAGAVGDLIGRRMVILVNLAWFSIGMGPTALAQSVTTSGCSAS